MKILACEGVPYLEENGLPFPAAFQEQSYPRTWLNGRWRVPEWNIDLEVPGCFNKRGDPLENFEGCLALEREFTLEPDGYPLKRLAFEGCFHSASVMLNGVLLGCSDIPWLPFYFDISGLVKYGEVNVLRVLIDNRIDHISLPVRQFRGHRPGWKLYAGIFRDVYIESLPALYCFKADISHKGGDVNLALLFHRCAGAGSQPLVVTAHDSEGAETGRASVEIRFREGNVAAAFLRLPMKALRLWSPEEPNLYRFTISTPGETLSLDTGFRSIAAEKSGIFLNGRPFTVKGVCRHEEHREYGQALPAHLVEQELSAIQSLGANLVRLAHYPHQELSYRLCDRAGLAVYTEAANYQAGLGIVQGLFGKSAELRKNRNSPGLIVELLKSTGQLNNPAYVERVRFSLLKLIERERNHPAVFFWGIGNECFSFSGASRRTLRYLKNEVLRFDSSRIPVYAAFTAPDVTPLFEQSLNVFDVLCINEYYGWYYGKPGGAEAYWKKIAKKYPHKALLITETGSDSFEDEESQARQCAMLAEHWNLRKKIPALSGLCVWVFKDFLCPEYGPEAPEFGCNRKGLFTEHYVPKKAAAFLRELWQDWLK
ncbi:MAG: hypothetical protein LBD48_13255 [Treponema sp.]|jgi:beta-glucuronidase|nr:hypothetical protein [Treponema sp.]